MYNSNTPASAAQELPSTRQLLRSTVIAAVVAIILLVTVVMPAEYGIDPTGIGNVIGLKRMGEIKTLLAQEAEADSAADALAASTTTLPSPAVLTTPIPTNQAAPPASELIATMNHEMTITLAPDEGTEIKVVMSKGSQVRYKWSTDGAVASFDVHGDSKSLGINYHNYSKGSEKVKEGVIEAAFDGSHGWYWRNRTSKPITITLQTSGQYTSINRF